MSRAEQFAALTAAQTAAQAEVDRLGAQRAAALAAWHAESGLSYARISEAVGLRRATVQQLIERGRRQDTTQQTQNNDPDGE